jgi:hypothetical protein
MATYDIHFQPIPADEIHGVKSITFGFTAALKVRGAQALVNRWLKTIMTPRGSDPLYPTRGTSLPSLIGQNIDGISMDVRDVVATAVEDANSQVQDQDVEGLYPDDESLSTATITQYTETDNGFDVWVTIKNQAGTPITLKLATLGTR